MKNTDLTVILEFKLLETTKKLIAFSSLDPAVKKPDFQEIMRNIKEAEAIAYDIEFNLVKPI